MQLNKEYTIHSPLLIELISSNSFSNLHKINLLNGKLPHYPIKTRTRVKLKAKRKRNSITDLSFYDVFCPIPLSTMSKTPPTSSAFFGVYNKTKAKLEHHAYSENLNQSLCHIFAVYMGHTASCLFRAPVDMYRAEKRVRPNLTMFEHIRRIINNHNFWKRSFHVLSHLVVRELPFCSIKFPLWEFLKVEIEEFKPDKTVEVWESVVCGALSGGIASALTLPVDLAYKRIYVEKKSDHYRRWRTILTIRDMIQENGVRGLFHGVRNRFIMISFGAVLFFGCYEQKKRILTDDD